VRRRKRRGNEMEREEGSKGEARIREERRGEKIEYES
jgi:hypothetical protein